ncbi:DUF488 domain-containing protein [Alicyclobacillus sp. SO9]|uniref:DUF488 domain-containing protein n=1 Tax=Alicyclobacillus sp. SO9 TaxID=2665646 RepID=UPI0021036A0C|nr:DUF488 family protein [Alicyclobacillus sp. SO9]
MPSPQSKRIYEPPDVFDGKRVLVDRLWPRGLRKDSAQIDVWLKEVAPSPDLRKWFGHEPERFDMFQNLYIEELNSGTKQQSAVAQLINWCLAEQVTLLYAAKDETHNHAKILRDFVDARLK